MLCDASVVLFRLLIDDPALLELVNGDQHVLLAQINNRLHDFALWPVDVEHLTRTVAEVTRLVDDGASKLFVLLVFFDQFRAISVAAELPRVFVVRPILPFQQVLNVVPLDLVGDDVFDSSWVVGGG
jgi:hypothetical protein